MKLRIVSARHKDNCVDVLFEDRVTGMRGRCLFWPPSCRHDAYVRGLVNFMQHQLGSRL